MKDKGKLILWIVVIFQSIILCCLWIVVDQLQTQYRELIKIIEVYTPHIVNEYYGGADNYQRILNYFGLEEKIEAAKDEVITLQKKKPQEVK